MEYQIPILDLTPGIQSQEAELTAAFQRVIRNTHFILGEEVVEFEKEMGAFLGSKYALGVNSGTDALFIALKSLGIGPGDEVLAPSFTFFATAEAISHVGAMPVFVDIHPETFNIDAEKVLEKINDRTKAIIVVHLFGQPAEMGSLLTIAKKHNLKVIEDVAQATGAKYQDKVVGSLGDVGAFSFFPSKNLGAFGDGGLLATQDENIFQVSKMLRSHGSKKKYYNEMIGYNSRLDELQAAFLRIRLRKLESWNEGRQRVAATYKELFSGVSEVVTPTPRKNTTHVFHQYTIRVKNGLRDSVKEALDKKGIMTMIYYPVPLHRLPVYMEYAENHLPHTDQASKEVISLPVWPEMDPSTQMKVVEAVKSALVK